MQSFARMEAKILIPSLLIGFGSILFLQQFAAGNPQASNPCEGKPDGVYADHSNCNHYFRCESQVKIVVNCHDGMIFDRVSAQCGMRAEYPCSADPANPTLIGTPCPGREGHLRPSVISCMKYLVCIRGHWTPIDCPLGLMFSEKTFNCIPEISKCETKETAAKKHTDAVTWKGKASPYVDICRGKMRQSVADPMRCSKYIFCGINPQDAEDRNPYLKFEVCPPGNLFSELRHKCRLPEKVVCGKRWRNVTTFGPEPAKEPPRIFG